MLDFKNSQISKALLIEKYFHPGVLNFFKKVFFVIFILLSAGFLIFHFFKLATFPEERLLGLVLIFFSLWGSLWVFLAFVNQKIRNPKIKDSDNLADFLDVKAAKAVVKALIFKKYSFDLSLFLILVGMTDLEFTFSKFLLFQEKVYETTEEVWGKEGFDEKDSVKEASETITAALKIAFEQHEIRISVFHLLCALIEKDPLVGKILFKLGVPKEDILEVILWQERSLKIAKERRKFWLKKNLLRKRGIGRHWAAGYTPFLDLYSRDITEAAQLSLPFEVTLHKKQLRQLEDALIRVGDNCALVVGEPGVGRRMMLLNLANRILSGLSYEVLNFNRIVEIDMPTLIASSRGLEDFELTLKGIFTEATNAGNVILIIHQIHNYIGANFGVKSIAQVDISGVIVDYIAHPEFRLIGITTPEGYNKALHKAGDIVNRFLKIEIPQPNLRETLLVLEEAVLEIEKQTKILITFPALKEIVYLADRYIGNIPFPKKALDILNEVVVYKAKSGMGVPGIVSKEEVEALISEKIEIPVGEVSQKEKNVLLNLEEIIHQRLIDQEEAVSEIANALRRARADIKTQKRTIGNFLFLGPTGVGKTETAKCLARAYFGSEKRIIRLDMSEYQEISSLEKLIGNEETPGYFTSMVRDDPFSLILLDEIEKAHPDILNLFLQVLDEGHLTDGAGRLVDFKNTIIIATSNAGANLIRDAIKEGKNLQEYKQQFIDTILTQGIFKPEFLNRFDGVILFKTLSKEDYQKIAQIMLEEIKEGLLQKEIRFKITPELVAKIGEMGFSPEFGAREMRRVVQEKVENSIAKAILAGAVKMGDEIEIDSETFEVKLTKL